MLPKELETEVISLLRLQGWKVEPETLVGHKKVDALATKSDDLGLPQRIAIEVKSGKSGCLLSDISKIYADYLPLVQARHIDSILLVTEDNLSAAGKTFISETPSIRHIRYYELLNRIIDFSHYVLGLRTCFEDSTLSDRYVPQNYKEGTELLEDRIISWAHSSESQPLAILGGYGIGKSTLARRIAYLFTCEYEKNPTNRIPILIPLSYLATDQHIEGLLGRLFTSNTSVYNYNYDLFIALNRRGRFLILMDGFDEMKRTMSWDTLQYNLSQLNQLIHKNSKVILLGRPTAFLNESEHNEALHGRRIINYQERKIPDWPDYLEIHIEPFTREQVKVYISKTLTSLEKQTNKGESISDQHHKLSNYLKKIEGPEGRQLVELVSRPVQLKMLIDILPDHEGDLSNFTVAMLYEEFIDLVIRRELYKDARRAFNIETRHHFAGKLAYTLWLDNQKDEINAEKISNEFFEEFSKSDDDDISAIRRDLLSGCFLERKPPNLYFFPHRSFQEYLVAERLVIMACEGKGDLANCPFLTSEIMSFFVELIGHKGILAWRKRIERNNPSLNENALDLFNTTCAYYKITSPFTDKTPKGVPPQSSVKKKSYHEPQMKRVLVSDIVSSERVINEKKEHKGRSKSPHKLHGVTRKKNF